jgi:uncharacterized protein (TIRG00374 family)
VAVLRAGAVAEGGLTEAGRHSPLASGRVGSKSSASPRGRAWPWRSPDAEPARAERPARPPGRPGLRPAASARLEDARAPAPAGEAERDGPPLLGMTRRRMVGLGAFVAAALAFLYVVLPQLGGVRHTWDRLGQGDAWWIVAAVLVEVVSMASYIAIFQGVHVPPGSPIRFRHSYQITMAGLAATRLFAAGGAGGVAVTAWSLRRSGMAAREVAQRMIAFLVLLYGVYAAALVVCGVGLYAGVFPGSHPFAITVLPALLGLVGIVVCLSLAFMPADLEQRLERRLARRLERTNRVRRLAGGLASLAGGVRFACAKLRHPDLALLGVVTWWGFNIAVLYASFRAFGEAPPVAVLVQAYFVGMLANLLPLPGGIGVVDGGMIGAFVAFGVSPSLAVPAVLVYRLFAFWLPSIPGVIAYVQLRRTVVRWGAAGGAAPEAASAV